MARKYAVMIEGNNFYLNGESIERIGFFTTRRVEAENKQEAEELALKHIKHELEMLDGFYSQPENPPIFLIEQVCKESIGSDSNKSQAAKQAAGDAVETMRTVILKEKTIPSNDPALPPVKVLEVRTAEQVGQEAAGSYMIDPADGVTVLNTPRSAGACFVAGTLVHTDKGLVPIEKLRVGDRVLSQPEMKGEQAYKRVVNTFSFEDKEVYLLMYATQDKVDQLAATDNHPFWVKDRGWVQASGINEGDDIELPDGSYAGVFCVKPIFRTATQDTGWVQGKYGRYNDFTGDIVNFKGDEITFGEEGVPNGEFSSANGDPRLKRQVFNIEVEDFHTYYVGEIGVWVHNTNCGGEGVKPENPAVDLRPTVETKL